MISRFRFSVFSFLFFFGFLFVGLTLVAQEAVQPVAPQPDRTQYASSEKEAAELGPNNKAFMESFTEYRELIKKLTAMKVEYPTARPERRDEIDAVYSGLYKQAADHQQKLVSLAFKAHEESPNRNTWVNDLLYSSVAFEFERDNYEESVRIFKHLSESGLEKGTERYYVFAGISALMSMNYTEAHNWLLKAGESGVFATALKTWSEQGNSGMQRVHTVQNLMAAMSESQEAWVKEQEIRKTEADAALQDPAKRLPRVELTTTEGVIVLELFENEAPNTVANFISLIEKGFYGGTPFHRVLSNFMVQGGSPDGSGGGGPGYSFDDECGRRFPQYRKHFRGSISMANSGPNTNGSQFFLNFTPIPHLDGRHTVFGRIVEGIDVLSDIQRYDPDDENAVIPELDKIVTAKVLYKRDHAYEVKKNSGR